jgi:diguanylate cyclase (GGDEF)-like protein
VERLSLQDPLTRAWNRRYLEAEFPGFVERARKGSGSAYYAVLDIDRFKALNDGFGHAVGDDVLRWVAHAITLHLGGAGHLVRTGGDEFVVLLEGEEPEQVFEAAIETIQARAAAEGPPRLPEISLSVGIVVVPDAGPVTLDDAYLAADGALYRAKRSGLPGPLRLASRALPPARGAADPT